MENRPIIFFRGRNVPPDQRERFQNWLFEAYVPILLKVEGVEKVEYYQIIKENPLYPNQLGFYRFKNRQAMESRDGNPDRDAVLKDMATFSRIEHFWSQTYGLLRSFDSAAKTESAVAKAEDTPVLHIESFQLPPEEQERCNDWYVKWAYRVYLPILMKLPGLVQYDRYRINDRREPYSDRFLGKPVVSEYPLYISVMYFENLKAFENYENSPELIAFRRIMKYEVSDNLNYEWYVQYQLLKNWRK